MRATRAITDTAQDGILDVLGGTADKLGTRDLEVSVAERVAGSMVPYTRGPFTSAGLDRTTKLRVVRQMLYTPTGLRGSSSLLGAGVGAIFGGPLAPIIVAVGLGFAVFEMRAAAAAAEQREARRHLAEVLSRWQRDLRQMLDDQLWQTSKVISQRFEESLQLQIRTLETDLKTLNERLSAGDGVDEARAEQLRSDGREAQSIARRTNARLGTSSASAKAG